MFFFFSSRRRHTRLVSDWSSDVCSSDLVHPLIWREANLVGTNMAFRLEQANKAGLIYGYSFDAYWLGGTRNTGWWKTITGLLLGTAPVRSATPQRGEPTELRGGTKGHVVRTPP